jgi:hypothetical protein
MPSEKATATATTHKRFPVTPWESISEPGAYVSCETGRLYRIPSVALAEGHSPVIQILGPQGEEMVTCLSTNPYTPVAKLRLLAADADIEPRF